MTTLQVRIQDDDKEAVRKILEKYGLDITTLVRMLFKTVRRKKSIPVEFVEPEEEKRFIDEEELLTDIEYTKKYGKKFHSTDELMKDLLDDNE